MIYKLLFCAAFCLLLSNEMVAQSKNFTPSWAPSQGFRVKTRHLYFPEYNFYFDLEKKVYIYLQSGRWINASELPHRLSNVNLRIAFKIELDLGIDNPQVHNNEHQMRYRPKYAVVDASM